MQWRNDQWGKSFDIAKRYYEQNGNLNVSYDESIDGLKLYDWIADQRKRYRKGKLAADRIEKLNSIGITWEFDNRWEVGFSHAETYFKAFGNLLVNINYICKDGYALGKWISAQRSRYNNPATQHPIKDEQIKKLETIGMQWRVQGTGWEDNFNLAKKYYETHGNLKIPRGFQFDGTGINLNTWIITQRNNRKKGKLSEDKIKKLDSIGMDWNGRSSNGEIAVTVSASNRVAI